MQKETIKKYLEKKAFSTSTVLVNNLHKAALPFLAGAYGASGYDFASKGKGTKKDKQKAFMTGFGTGLGTLGLYEGGKRALPALAERELIKNIKLKQKLQKQYTELMGRSSAVIRGPHERSRYRVRKDTYTKDPKGGFTRVRGVRNPDGTINFKESLKQKREAETLKRGSGIKRKGNKILFKESIIANPESFSSPAKPGELVNPTRLPLKELKKRRDAIIAQSKKIDKSSEKIIQRVKSLMLPGNRYAAGVALGTLAMLGSYGLGMKRSKTKKRR